MLAKRCGSNPPRDVQVHYSLSAELPIASHMAELSLLSAKFLKQEPGSPGRINRQGFIHPAATMALPFGVFRE